MENILVLDTLCTWRSFSRLLLTGAATVLALAGSLGIARGSTVGCPSSPITFAMALQLYVPASDTPCDFAISDFLLDPNSEGQVFFSFFTEGGQLGSTYFDAQNEPILSVVNGITTVVGTEAEFCYNTYNRGYQCPLPTTGPLGSNLGPLGVTDYENPLGDNLTATGELTVYLSGTVAGQPATLGLAIYDDPFGPYGAVIALPEPSTYATLGIGVLAMVVFRRKIGRTFL